MRTPAELAVEADLLLQGGRSREEVKLMQAAGEQRYIKVAESWLTSNILAWERGPRGETYESIIYGRLAHALAPRMYQDGLFQAERVTEGEYTHFALRLPLVFGKP